ncbi:MAG: MFS transporter [Sutterellaceae bacterium]|nr:MFS transporter [Sutterellaceae bacterium]
MTVSNERVSPSRGLWSYCVVASTIVCTFAAASFPVPLLAVWSKDLQLTPLEVSLTVMSYVFGCIVTLLFFARLSDALGRRRALVPAQILGIVSCFILMSPESATALFVGRLLQGLYSGMVISSAMPWAIDMAPKKHRWMGSAVSVAGPSLGMVLGTLSCGVLAQTGLVTVSGLFEFLAAVMALLLLAFLTATEPVIAKRPNLVSVLKPVMIVPAAFRQRFLTAMVVFVGICALTCYFQGFSAYVAGIVFTDSSVPIVMAAVIYVSLIVPNAFGGVLFGKMDSDKVLLGLTAVFCLAGILLFASVAMSISIAALLFLTLCGLTGGGLCSVTLYRLIHDAKPEERASLISCLFLIGDIGTGIPSFLIGKFVPETSLWGSTYVFAAWFTSVLVLTVWSVIRSRTVENLRHAIAI